MVLEPIFEADFVSCRMGSGRSGRPRRRWSGFVTGSSRVTRSWWSSISPISSARSTMTGYSSRWAAGLGSAGTQAGALWLQAGVMVDGVVQRTVAGTPQGGVISPLLANIYLHVLDTELSPVGWASWCATPMTVWCCAARRRRPRRRWPRSGEILAALGLRLHPDKTKVVDLREGREASISWAVISGPACRGGCGNRSGSCATTCTAGPARRR